MTATILQFRRPHSPLPLIEALLQPVDLFTPAGNAHVTDLDLETALIVCGGVGIGELSRVVAELDRRGETTVREYRLVRSSTAGRAS